MNSRLNTIARTIRNAVLLLPGLVLLPAGDAAGRDQKIIRGNLPPMPEITDHPEPEGLQVETFISGLEVVWAMQFAPEGRLFAADNGPTGEDGTRHHDRVIVLEEGDGTTDGPP